MSTPVIDQRARDMAQAANARMDAHEQVCAQRWGSTMAMMKEIKTIIAWGGVTAVMILLAALGLK